MSLDQVLSLAEPALRAPNPKAASAAFFSSMKQLGASYLQTRAYRRPPAALTSATHWAAGGFILRESRPGWENSAAFNFVCFKCNPLLNAIGGWHTRYRFSDFAPRDKSEYANYWDAMSEAGIYDALCATSYASHGRIASLHLGFEKRKFSKQDALGIHLAGLMLTERILDLGIQPDADHPVLTPRERDCLSYVAAGKSDWEISVIMGISQATAKFHVDNARRKLNAVNRAHAVARFFAGGLFASDSGKSRP